MAQGDLTDITTVANWLDINPVPTTGQTTYTILTGLITAASKFITNWLNRQILSASYTDKYNGNGKNAIKLNNWPITAVSSVQVGLTTIQPSPDGISGGYVFDDKFLYILPGTMSGPGFLGSGLFDRGIMNVTVSYTAGYATIPSDIQQACTELVSSKYRERSRIGKKSDNVTVGGQGTTYTLKDLSDDTKAMLQNYKNVVPS